MVNVPSQYQLYVTNAANQLGISPDIVAAQIQTESNWDPNANSGAGAEGIAQFLPGTFSQYGSGSPYNVTDAFNAYTNYMSDLLRTEHGNIRDALAAYNAGPGNLSAGYAYADGILGLSGSGMTTSTGGVVQASSNILSWPKGITDTFDMLSSGVFWMRVGMVIAGCIIGIVALVQMSNVIGKTVNSIPIGKAVKAVGKKVGRK